jgi:hypothetical protein
MWECGNVGMWECGNVGMGYFFDGRKYPSAKLVIFRKKYYIRAVKAQKELFFLYFCGSNLFEIC